MTKKITLLATATALVAFAVPALAGAAPQITYPAGTRLAVGTAITGTSTNWVTTTSLGDIKCAKKTIPAVLITNSELSVEAKGSGEATTVNCSVEGESIKTTDFTLTNLKSTTTGSGTATFSFKADLPVVGTCTYTAINAPFTYATGGSSINFYKATLAASPSACGTAKLDADVSLEKTSGGNVLILD